MLTASRRRGQAVDHVLFAGPPGLGKTTLAGIIATEMGARMQPTSGPALERAGDLAAILTNLDDGGVLFIDEIHGLPRAVEEVLYPAMEDFQLDIVIGKGPSARTIRLDLPRFTLVGATTRTGLITGPLRDRFGFVARLDYYEVDDLTTILVRAAQILGVELDPDGASEIASRSRGTPRIANRLLKRVRDYAEVRAAGTVTLDTAPDALAPFEADEVSYEVQDRIARVAIANGKANALSPAVVTQLDDALTRAEDAGEEQVGALLITGAPGMLSGGFDLAVMRSGGAEAGRLVTDGGALITRLFGSEVPVVIACTGHAVAAGALLLLGADVRIGAQGAFRIGLIGP